MSTDDRQASAFVTFYSFKGGVGRTMALVNAGGILAKRGFKVLLIDLDLEAPGLSYLGSEEQEVEDSGVDRWQQPGFVDLMANAVEHGEEGDLFALSSHQLAEKYARAYPIPDSVQSRGGLIHIMPAGRFDDAYSQRFDALNLHALYEAGIGEPLVRAFKKKIGEAQLYDYVLVDSRTGFSDEAGICTRDLADCLLVLSGLNRQNIEGTCDFLRALRRATVNQDKKLQIILSPVPNGEDELLDRREAIAKEVFEEAWPGCLANSLRIPYHPRLALTEEPHIFRRQRGYLYDAYKSIEHQMRAMLGHDEVTLLKHAQELLNEGDYHPLLTSLNWLSRLDRGGAALGDLAHRMVLGRRANIHKGDVLGDLLSSDEGLAVLRFVMSHMPLTELDISAATSIASGLERRAPELAYVLYDRIVETAPLDGIRALPYLRFLKSRDAAQARTRLARLFEHRDTHTDPGQRFAICNGALFLHEFDMAEVCVKEAMAQAPGNVLLSSYYGGILLMRGDGPRAQEWFEIARHGGASHLEFKADYGQLLVGVGKVEEGIQMLTSAFETLSRRRDQLGNFAEVCFALWLSHKMKQTAPERWERHFKYAIEAGFPRHPWSFDFILKAAKPLIASDDYSYAKALAAAFLDEEKLADLNRLERWRALQSLPPAPRKVKKKERGS